MQRILLFLLVLLFSTTGSACSIFTAAKGDRVLTASNEDGDDPFGKIWTMPSRPGRYGGVYFGLSFLDKQAGMNEHGLFFDFAAQLHSVHRTSLSIGRVWRKLCLNCAWLMQP